MRSQAETIGLHQLVGGSAGPGYILLQFDELAITTYHSSGISAAIDTTSIHPLTAGLLTTRPRQLAPLTTRPNNFI